MATPWTIARPGSKVGITITDPAIADSAALALATIAEFEDFTCLIVSAVFTPTAGTDTRDLEGTFCEPATSVPVASKSTWSLDVRLRQDANDSAGISAFLLANDGTEAWMYVSTGDTDAPPKFLGHGYLSAAALGGAPAEPLYSDVSFRLLEAPIAAYPAVTVMAATASDAA